MNSWFAGQDRLASRKRGGEKGRLWTSRWDFLESEGDIPDSWHLIWVHHKTYFIRFFLIVWAAQITQLNFGLVGFLRFTENAQFWGSSPLKIAFWGSEKWKSWVSKHRSAQLTADVRARQITRIKSGGELTNILQVSVLRRKIVRVPKRKLVDLDGCSGLNIIF